MKSQPSLLFPPFSLDVANEQLWRETQLLPLRPKPFAILRYLTEHAGRLVSKEELQQAIWGKTQVKIEVLNTYIRLLREVLGDEAKTPHYIETVVGRGYRFIGPITTTSTQSGGSQTPHHPTGEHYARLATWGVTRSAYVVGRESELEQLLSWWDKALQGERQMVFVTGEPGIGKTTLVEMLLPQVAARDGALIGIGRCIEQYGAGEPYLPVLEALGRLCRSPKQERLCTVLGRQAPTWLMQLPALLEDTELHALQQKVQGVTRERMLRELAEALEVLTIEQPLVLWLEDLQWSDYATLDLLAAVAQRREAARLLMIGTYRPTDVVISGHPLKAVKQELQAHRRCVELPLGCLSEAEVAAYVAVRFPQHQFPPTFTQVMYQRTDGIPFFLVTLIDEWVTRGIITQTDGVWALEQDLGAVAAAVPENILQMIEQHIEWLNPQEERLLEAGSVAGAEFSAAIVAAALGADTTQVENWCEHLVRRRLFLQATGVAEWPDGTVAGRYSFQHALYHKVWYERVPPARRVQLHLAIGERAEHAYCDQVGEHAGTLAMHFEQGRDFSRAVMYRHKAAEYALQLSVYRVAIIHAEKGLYLLKDERTAPMPDRLQYERNLQMTLGVALAATEGFAAPKVRAIYTHAEKLLVQRGDTLHSLRALFGDWLVHLIHAELNAAGDIVDQIWRITEDARDPSLHIVAYITKGITLFHTGQLTAAKDHLEQSLALYDPHLAQFYILTYGQDPQCACLNYLAWTLWHLGYPDQALEKSQFSLAEAEKLSHGFSLCFALDAAAGVHRRRREARRAQTVAEDEMTLAGEHGFPYWLGQGMITRGWAMVEQGQIEKGVQQIEQGIDRLRETQTTLDLPFSLTLLAEGYRKAGKRQEGLDSLAEALSQIEKTEEWYRKAEVYLQQGRLLLAPPVSAAKRYIPLRKVTADQHHWPEAERYLQMAITTAQQQESKSLELRATMSLALLWQQQSKKNEARQRLAEIYSWFTEGFDTKDLQEAKALLDTLA